MQDCNRLYTLLQMDAQSKLADKLFQVVEIRNTVVLDFTGLEAVT